MLEARIREVIGCNKVVMVFALISIVADMKDNGFKINSMDMVSNNGQMVLNMKDNMNRE